MLEGAGEEEFEVTIQIFLKDTEMVVKQRIEVIVKECILTEFQQGVKAAGSAAP